MTRQSKGPDGSKLRLPAPAVAIAAEILDLLANELPRAGLSDIARRLSLNKSTGFNVLQTLVHYSLVSRVRDTSLYQLGPKLVHLGATVRQNVSQRGEVRAALSAIVRETGVTGVIAQPLGDKVSYVILERVAGPDDPGIAPPIGLTYPLTAPAIGRAALSSMDEEEAIEIARDIEQETGSFDERRWRTKLREIRAQGYATSRQDDRKGVNAVASAVLWAGDPFVIVALVGPTASLSDDVLDEYGRRLAQMAHARPS